MDDALELESIAAAYEAIAPPLLIGLDGFLMGLAVGDLPRFSLLCCLLPVGAGKRSSVYGYGKGADMVYKRRGAYLSASSNKLLNAGARQITFHKMGIK